MFLTLRFVRRGLSSNNVASDTAWAAMGLGGRLLAKWYSGTHEVTQPRSVETPHTVSTFETQPYKLHKMADSPSTHVTMSRDEGLQYYSDMATIRRLEDVAESLYKKKSIRGFLHLYSGQEACCVGVEAALDKDDAVISAYRIHGWALMRGVSLHGIMAELTGRKTGCTQGKGGSMHMYAPAQNLYGGLGIIGSQVPIGAGISFALKYEGKPNVCVVAYGDGAANQGQVFETFNMAKLWKLPVVFLCENNGYAMYTPESRAAASTEYYTRGDYVPGIKVDGMDVLAVREATRFAREYALTNGPIVIEAVTYRYHGHSMSESGATYRTQAEIQSVMERKDPVLKHGKRLLDSRLASIDELEEINEEINERVDEAATKAQADPELPLKDLYNALVKDPPADMTVRGCDFTIRANTTSHNTI